MVIPVNTVICTPTQADYDELMEYLEELGCTWSGVHPATKKNYWHSYASDTSICIDGGSLLGYSDTAFFRQYASYNIYTLEDFFSLVGHVSSVNSPLIETWPW